MYVLQRVASPLHCSIVKGNSTFILRLLLLCSGPHYIEAAGSYPDKSTHRNECQMCINVHMIFPKKKPDAYEHTHRAFMIAIHFSMLGGNQGRLCLPQHPVPYDPLLFAERIHASILPGEPLAEYPSNLSAYDSRRPPHRQRWSCSFPERESVMLSAAWNCPMTRRYEDDAFDRCAQFPSEYAPIC